MLAILFFFYFQMIYKVKNVDLISKVIIPLFISKFCHNYFRMLNLTITYSPISLFRWQMYAAQSMKNKWYGMFGGDMLEDDSDQDSLKVSKTMSPVPLTINNRLISLNLLEDVGSSPTDLAILSEASTVR